MANLENKVVTNMTVYVDDASRNAPAFLYAKQYDANSRFIKVRLMQATGPISITGVAQLNCTKPSGQLVYTAGTINDDGTATFELTSNMLTDIGTASCDISLFSSEDSTEALLTSSSFKIVVEKTNYNQNAIEGFDEFSTVSDVLAQVSETKDEIEGLKSDIENDILQKADGLEVEDNQFYLLSGSTRLTDGVSLTLDTTLTESGEPADAKAVGDTILEFKQQIKDITGNEYIPIINGAYINLSGQAADISSPTSNANSKYAVIPCSPGDVFSITTRGGTSARAYGFLNSNGVILSVSPASTTYEKLELIAPDNASTLVVNGYNFTPIIWKNELLVDLVTKVYNDINLDVVPIPFEIINDKGIYYDGNEHSSNYYDCTNFIDVRAYTKVFIKRIGVTASSSDYGIAYYDVNRQSTSFGIKVLPNQDSFGYVRDMELNLTPTTAYIRACVMKDPETNGYFEIYGVTKTGELNYIINEHHLIKQDYEMPCTLGRFIKTVDGSIVGNDKYLVCGRLDGKRWNALKAVPNDGEYNYRLRLLGFDENCPGLSIANSNGFVSSYLGFIYYGDFDGHIVRIPSSWKYIVLSISRLDGNNVTDSDVASVKNCITLYGKTDRSLTMYDCPADAGEIGSRIEKVESVVGKTTRRNNPTNVSDMLTVARSWLNETSLIYGTTTILDKSTSTTSIDCSTFVGLVLRGISYEESPYYTHNWGSPSALIANPNKEWSLNPFEWENKINTSDPLSPVRKAAQLAQWMADQGWVVPMDEHLANVRPGDIAFWARKESDGTYLNPTRFMHITHIAIVTSRDPAPTDDATWDRTKYPYKHKCIEVTAVTPPCTEDNLWLEKGQEDPTDEQHSNINTLVLVCRPDLL